MKGGNPATDCEVPYAGATASCIADPAKGAQAKYAAAILKACTKAPTDCPSCYSGGDCSATGEAAAAVANLEAILDVFAPAVACTRPAQTTPPPPATFHLRKSPGPALANTVSNQYCGSPSGAFLH